MGTLQTLTLRTATAVGRLADLQRRAEKVAENRSTLAKTALAELSTALEELQVANEALQEQLAELKALRTSTKDAVDRADEFAHVLPVAAVWTDRAGAIESGNDAAAQLLNVGHQHLVGKSLMLFITDRGALFTALRSLCEPHYMSAVDVDVTVRPRERRPRKMKLAGRRLQHDNRCLWFFHTPEPAKQEEIHAVGAEV